MMKLLTTEQTADVLGIKPQSLAVWRLRGTPRLPFRKIGQLVRYAESDIEKFLASATRTSTSENQKAA